MFMNTTLVAQEAEDEIRRIRQISNKVWKGTVKDDIGKYFTDDNYITLCTFPSSLSVIYHVNKIYLG